MKQGLQFSGTTAATPRREDKKPPTRKPPPAPKPGGKAWLMAAAVIAVLGIVTFVVNRRSTSPRFDGPKSLDTSAGSPFSPTVANTPQAPGPTPEGMVWIPGGEFSMGSTAETESLCGQPGVTRDALPVHRVYVDGFWMDATELTNEEFEKFVRATGYITVAERTPTKE